MKKFVFFAIFLVITTGISAQVAGTFDLSFNGTGIYVEPANIVGDNVFLQVQPDGKIVVAGSTDLGTQIHFFVMRFHADGSKDTGFGINGALVSVFGSDDMIVKDMILQDNGKIALAGHFSPPDKGFIVQINSDGQINTGFGLEGLAAIDLYGDGSEYISGIDIQFDENDNWGYVLSGHYKRTTVDAKVTSFIVRAYASGLGFDNSFIPSEDIYYGSDSYNTGLYVQPDNTILAAGWYDSKVNTTRYFNIAKKTSTGEDDNTFGIDPSFSGFTSFNFNNGYELNFHGFSVLDNNKLLFVGEYEKSGETSNWRDVFVLRTTENGAMDWAYGGENHSYKYFEFSPGGYDKAYCIQEIQDGKTLISGAGGDSDAAIACLDSLGAVDTEFGIAGKFIFDVQGEPDIILSSGLNNDKSILYVAGRSFNANTSNTDLFLAAIHTSTDEQVSIAEPETNFSRVQNKIILWPNPVEKSGTINLDLQAGNRQKVWVEMFNTNGQLMRSYPITSSTTTIKLPNELSSGIYILKFSGEDLSVTKKLIVK